MSYRTIYDAEIDRIENLLETRKFSKTDRAYKENYLKILKNKKNTVINQRLAKEQAKKAKKNANSPFAVAGGVKC